jgi:hypothetical protein
LSLTQKRKQYGDVMWKWDGTDDLEELGSYGRIILKWIKIYGDGVRNGCI